MADDAELVALGISEVGAIVVLVVFRARTWCALGTTPTCQCCRVNRIDNASALRLKSHHLTVTGLMLRPIVWRADEKQWPRPRNCLPSSPRPRGINKALFYPQQREDGYSDVQYLGLGGFCK